MAAVGKEPCPQCRENGHDKSGNNLHRFSDGGATCFRGGCGYWEAKDGSSGSTTERKMTTTNSALNTKGSPQALVHRRISQATCRDYKYDVAPANGVDFEYANFLNSDGDIIGQKRRNPETKEFRYAGTIDGIQMFGAHLLRPGGPMVVVTEGEIDAMSVYEAFDRKYPAVSLTRGSAGAVKDFKASIDLLNSFGKVIIFFDNDEAGREAAKKAAEVLKPGTAYIANLDGKYKDANEALLASDAAAITKAVYMPKEYRPDGIVHIKDVSMILDLVDTMIFDFPYECMTQAAYGITGGEVVVMASGSGMGKSTVFKEMIKYHLDAGHTVGALMLEESVTKTKQDIASIHIERPIHLALTAKAINDRRREQNKEAIDFGHSEVVSPEQLAMAEKYMEDKQLFLYDHWGSLQVERLMKRLEYMHYACGCEIIYIDHLSIIVSGVEGGDERKDLDHLMAELKAFAQRTGVAIIAICHLRKSGSKPHEEGGQVSLQDFRGSGALYQYSDKCFGFERNQQDSSGDSNLMMIRLLKNRFSGKTGIIGAARFYPERHRLIQCEIVDHTGFKDTTEERT